MAIIKCPECGHDVSNKASSCPNCGYILEINPIEKIKCAGVTSAETFRLSRLLFWGSNW